jgi:hypothetical protein
LTATDGELLIELELPELPYEEEEEEGLGLV